MLLERRAREGILDGSVTVLFRRWRRAQAVAGHTYRTAAGLIAVDEVTVVDPAALGDDDAGPAGYDSADQLRAELKGTPGDPVYRLRVRAAGGPDPRDELAAVDDLTSADLAELDRRLARLDRASADGPWTASILAAVRDNPGRRAGDLAAAAGRQLQSYKLDVRKLKALGLTHSLTVGYRLSPRGEAYLRASAHRRPPLPDPPSRSVGPRQGAGHRRQAAGPAVGADQPVGGSTVQASISRRSRSFVASGAKLASTPARASSASTSSP